MATHSLVTGQLRHALKRFRIVTLWNRKGVAEGISIFFIQTRDIRKNLSKYE